MIVRHVKCLLAAATDHLPKGTGSRPVPPWHSGQQTVPESLPPSRFSLLLSVCPVGISSAWVHMVGKHIVSLQKTLHFPPNSPVGPVMTRSMLNSGFTQYGQQCPSAS